MQASSRSNILTHSERRQVFLLRKDGHSFGKMVGSLNRIDENHTDKKRYAQAKILTQTQHEHPFLSYLNFHIQLSKYAWKEGKF